MSVCIRCSARFDPVRSLGQWECRLHPAAMSGLSRSPIVPLACCGYCLQRVTDAASSTPLPPHYAAFVHPEDAVGCVRCDHTTAWGDMALACVAVVAKWRLRLPPIPSALLWEYGNATLAQVLAGPAGGTAVPVPVAYPAHAPHGMPDVRDALVDVLKREYRDPAFYAWWASRSAADKRAVETLQENVKQLAKRIDPGTLVAEDEDGSSVYAELGAYLESPTGAAAQPAIAMCIVRQVAPAQDAATLYRMQRLNAAYMY